MGYLGCGGREGATKEETAYALRPALDQTSFIILLLTHHFIFLLPPFLLRLGIGVHGGRVPRADDAANPRLPGRGLPPRGLPQCLEGKKIWEDRFRERALEVFGGGRGERRGWLCSLRVRKKALTSPPPLHLASPYRASTTCTNANTSTKTSSPGTSFLPSPTLPSSLISV